MKKQDYHLNLVGLIKTVKMIVVIRNTIQDLDKLRLNGHQRRLSLGSKSHLRRKRRIGEISRLTVASPIREEDNKTKTMTAKRILEGKQERRKETKSLLKKTSWRVCENFSF